MVRRPLQSSYGFSVVSTESSGGGLPFTGVFSHEQIYTVSLDMRQTETDPDNAWTLRVRGPREARGAEKRSSAAKRGQTGTDPSIPSCQKATAAPRSICW